MTPPTPKNDLSELDRPTWAEISALDSLLRDREDGLRPHFWWDWLWPRTELLESLRAKVHRWHHSRQD